MTAYGWPALYAVFVWWFSTGLILLLNGLPRRTFPASLAGATLVAAGAVAALAWAAGETSAAGAYVAFTAALLVWGWLELAFLTGALTGPSRAPCPAGAAGWRRVGHAVEAILFHELAAVLLGLVIVAATFGGPNQVGAWTYAVLWAMRLSAKLNLFLGVPNLGLEFLPDHLRYLGTFMRRGPMTPLLPASIAASSALAWQLARAAAAPGAAPFEAAGFSLLAALVALAVLEHLFMVLPLPAAALWAWGLGPRARAAATAPPSRDAVGLRPTLARARAVPGAARP